ncbi:MAG TPA: DNA-formamidopyrimidine glycosylase family protein [Actinomycetota bacterium]
MPEGDTIHRTATTLRAVIDGHTLDRSRFAHPTRQGGASGLGGTSILVPGERIGPIEARGKHLLIGFSGGLTLHTHLQMSGSWHTYRPGERWQRPSRQMVVALTSTSAEAVCFNAPVVELLDPSSFARHPQLNALGPDLCVPGFDADEVARRLQRTDQATPMGVVLLDQTIASGIGNVFKSEALWARSLDPFAPLSSVDAETRQAVYRTASDQLRANLAETGPRRTVPQGLAVYDRAGQPCRRCGTPIRTRRQGSAGRSTWWCPACQT